MADYQKVTVSTEETGANAPTEGNLEGQGQESLPNDPENMATEGMGEGVEGQQVETYGVDSDRPEWLPEKFNSPEDMAQAYENLESKMGSEEEAGVETPEGAPTNEALAPYAEEYFSTGKLSDSAFADLEGMGLSRDLVETFIKGQEAVQEQDVGTIYNAVGGQQNYNELMAWAAQTLSPEEIASYNSALESGSVGAATMAARGLQAMMGQGEGAEAQLLGSAPVGSGTAAYQSLAQLLADMGTSEYKTDPSFRKRVEDRLSISNIM